MKTRTVDSGFNADMKPAVSQTASVPMGTLSSSVASVPSSVTWSISVARAEDHRLHNLHGTEFCLVFDLGSPRAWYW